jgi:type IV secretory pathway TraG/TraD family ATPase VirD4
MTSSIRQAIHERALYASLEFRLREALRCVLLTAALWVEMTVCLVWHWSGHYGGPAAHRYFIRWFLAWFLTQEIPLSFASLPYHGGRYTIASMYAFLNYKYYLGGSFAAWYWHYAPWGAALTGLIEAAAVAVLLVRSGPGEARHIRGVTLVPARKLARKLGGRAGVRLAGVRIPRALECQHFLVTGSTGSGKSVAIRSLLRQIEQRGETAVVVDPECEFVPEFYQPGRGDFILNPLDARCPRWSPWRELRDQSHDADCEALAASLLPDPPDAYHEGGASFFFRQSSRTLLTSIFRIAEPKEASSIPRLLTLPRAELRRALAGMPAEALIDPGAHEQGAGIVATAANATKAFHYLPENAPRSWSALEWSAKRQGWLFLTSSEESKDAALQLQSVWLDCIIHRLLSRELRPRRQEQVWIVADELPVLRRQAKLEDLVVRGRKRGLAVVLGFQAITQLRTIYGVNQAATLVASPATKLILRTGEPETAQWCSAQIGEREVERGHLSANASHREQYSFGIREQRTTEPAVMPAEMQLLQPLSGYLCVTGHHRSLVRLDYLAPQVRQEAFIPRINLPLPVKPGRRSHVIALRPTAASVRRKRI